MMNSRPISRIALSLFASLFMLAAPSWAQDAEEGEGLGDLLGAIVDEVIEDVVEGSAEEPLDEPEPAEEKPSTEDAAPASGPALGTDGLPPLPTAAPTPPKSYEEMQAELTFINRLVRLGTRPRPEAPARENERDEDSSADDSEPSSEDFAAAGTTFAPSLDGPLPFAKARPTNPPPHTIVPTETRQPGILTVFPDGSRSVIASNTRKPKDQVAPKADPYCPARLRALGVDFVARPDFVRESGCQNLGVVRVANLGSGVQTNGPLDVTCPVAEALALWFRNTVQNETALYFGSRVSKISNHHGYACRFRSGGRVSEHGFANAIDIGTFHLADGRKVDVLKHWHPDGTPFGENSSRWFDRINEDACDYFQVVLNPRSNKAHENHFHFDLGPWKSCD